MRAAIKFLGLILGTLLVSELLPAYSYGRAGRQEPSEIEKSALRLKSQDIDERLKASVYLKKQSREELGPTLLSQVTGQFLAEVRAVKRFNELTSRPEDFPGKVPSELLVVNTIEWKMYFMNLRDIAAKSGDPVLLPDLIAYKVSPEELGEYGEAAIGPLLDELNSREASQNSSLHGRRLYAVQALVGLIKEKEKGYVARGPAKEKIKAALVDCALKDSDNPLRAVVIKFFGDLGDEGFVPVLEELSRNDKWSSEAVADPRFDKDVPPGQKVTRYPARVKAREALEKIKQKTIH